MTKPEKQRLRWVTIATISFTLIGLSLAYLWVNGIFFTNDMALSLAVAEAILWGDFPLLGPPSHAGGRHLGPIYYYALTVLHFISAKKVFVLSLLLTLLKCLSLTLGIYAVFRLSRKASLYFFCFIPLVSAFYYQITATLWHGNFVVIISSAVVLTLVNYLLNRSYLALSLLALSSSCLLQTQLASLPVVACTLVLAVISRPEGKISGTACLIASSALFIWVPTAIAEIYGPQNLLRLYSTHSSTSKSAGLLNSFLGIGEFLFRYSINSDFIYSFSELQRKFFFGAYATSLILLSFLRSRGEIRILLLWSLGIILCYWLALSLAKAPVHTYYMHSALPLPALLFGASLDLVFQGLREGNIFKRAICLAIFTALLGLAFLGMLHTLKEVSGKKVNPISTAAHAEEFAAIVKKYSFGSLDVIGPGVGITEYRENAYLYFMGRNFHPRMSQWDILREMRQAETSKDSNALVYECSPIEPRKKERLIRKLRQRGLSEAQKLDLSGCSSCKNCTLIEFVTQDSD